LKTAGASVLSLYVCRWLALPEGYWAAVSAIIVMQSNLRTTWHDGLSRLAGTAIGAVVGGAAVMVLGNDPWSFGLAVIVAMSICAVLDRWESYRFASVTVAIAMLVARPGSPWVVVLHRFFTVSIGIVTSLLVIFVWR
jgi:uncharacterized membrane protein YgaE (UPF0421/DUF939 family)